MCSCACDAGIPQPPPYPKLPEVDGSLIRSGLTSLRELAPGAEAKPDKRTVSEEVELRDGGPPPTPMG